MARGKRIFGFVMICVSLLALFSWENFGRARFIYDEALVLRKDVERGQKITSDMLKTVNVENAQKDALKPRDKEWLLKQSSRQYVRHSMPLYKEYFIEDKYITSGKGRFQMQLPERWISSCPGDIRRGDKVRIESADGLSVKANVIRNDNESKSIEVVLDGHDARGISKAATNNNGLVIYKY